MHTMHQRYVARTIIPAGQLAHTYGTDLLKGIDKNAFARHAVGARGERVKSNHPAWVYGHLACYPARMLEFIGHPEAAKLKKPRFEDLFKNGTECLDDPNGTIYPTMEEIVGAWDSGNKRALEVLADTPDEAFERENPAEGRFKERFPKVGGAIAFMIAAHPMSHFGQVSAWRRFMGMPSAM